MDTTRELSPETWSRYFDEVIDHPQRITVNSTAMPPICIMVDDREGVRTVVTIEPSAAFGG